MEERLRGIAEDATKSINALLDTPLTGKQSAEVEKIVEKAVIGAMLEGQHRAVDAALQCPEADRDIAHKIATAIRLKNDALIVNLSSLR